MQNNHSFVSKNSKIDLKKTHKVGNAIIDLNKMIIKRDKTAPMEQESQKVRGI